MIKKTLTEEQWCVRSHNWSELRWAKNSDLFIFYTILFIYILFFGAVLGLCCWVGFSTVAASRDFSLVVFRRLLSSGGGPSCCSFQAPEHRLSSCGPQASCGSHSMWDLPRSRFKPVSPALAGGFFTTEPLWKPRSFWFSCCGNLNKLNTGTKV